LNEVTGPSGIARPAATVPREAEAAHDASVLRTEAGKRAEGIAARVGPSAVAEAPAARPPGAAEELKGTGAPARPAHSVYGALDLGTNNCRLLIAKPSRRGFVVIDAFSRIIRLGEGVTRTGKLSDEAMKRTINALRVCADKMRRRGVTRSRLIATEACRITSNGAAFIEEVRNETGLALEIVGRETEAKLAVSGCASLLDRNCDWALVFDIGGGSSELIWLDLRRLGRSWTRSLHQRVGVQNCIAAWTSLPVGVVSLAERHGGRDVTVEGYEGMVDDVMTVLKSFEAQYCFRERIGDNPAHFLGTSGTVTTISGIHLDLPYYERSRVDGCWLTAEDVRTVSGDLVAMTYAERIAQPCIGQERADLVLAGCAILEALLRVWPCQRLRVADRGLREGILATLMAEDGHDRGAQQRPSRRRRKKPSGNTDAMPSNGSRHGVKPD
jgi:exopolyphosphatase/guanosine-5'-triphosphate,3'-diphosphate pyrophosphatase